MSDQPDGQKVRLHAVVVTYEPDRELPEVLAAVVGEVDHLLVWDNSESPAGRAFVQEAVGRSVRATAAPDRAPSRVDLRRSPANVGLAAGFNAALARAAEEGADLLLLLDQDSRVRPGAVERLRTEYARLRSRISVGALAARNLERTPVRLSPKPALGRIVEAHYAAEHARGRLYRDAAVAEVWSASNSGLAVNVAAARSVGGFDPQLFLDAIDYEFEARLRRAGHHLLRVLAAEVDHSQGQPRATRVGTVHVRLRTYAPVRSYYLVRDTLLAARKVRAADPRFAGGIVVWMALGTVGAVALLPPRAQRLREVLRGLVAGLREPLRSVPAAGGAPPG